MEKESAEYGFKAFPDREQAVELIDDRNNFDSAMALDATTNTDYDYGFMYNKRKALSKLEGNGLSDAIKDSEGFIEEVPGYTKKPDIYATPEGALQASKFIREEILPKYPHNEEEIQSALQNELNTTQRINDLRESHLIKKEDIKNDIINSRLNYQTTRDAGFFNKIRGDLSKVHSLVDSGRLALDESLYRHKVDQYKRKMADVPDNVLYTRFADAIDQSVADGNQLYNFRYY